MTLAFLDRDELRTLSGRQQRAKVSAWLTANGYRFDTAADGWPRVLRAAVEQRLMAEPGKRRLAKAQPDFTAYGSPQKAA
jgi:hypothetical protein